MSKIEILRNSSCEEMIQIESFQSIIGASLERYSIGIDKTIGVLYINGWAGKYSEEQSSISIYFRIPETAPAFEDFVEMINSVIGTNNKHDNHVMFNHKFFEKELEKAFNEFFKELQLPFLDESQVQTLIFENITIHNAGRARLEGKYISDYDRKNRGYAIEPPMNVVSEYWIDLNTKKLMFRIKDKGMDPFVANADHEAIYARFVKDDIVKMIRDNFHFKEIAQDKNV